MPRVILTLFVLALFSGSAAAQDEVLLKNGDRISGTLIKLDGGKLVLKSPAAGEVTLDWGQVRTLSTAAPVKLVLTDGVTLERRLAAGEGESVLAEGGDLPLAPLSLGLISAINPPKQEASWTGDLSIGASKTTGNTETTAVSGTLEAIRRSRLDRFTFGAGWFYSEQENPSTGRSELTERRVYSGINYDYFLSKKWYVNANTRAEGSKAANLDLRYTAGGGLGYQFFESADFKLSGEAGVGYFYEKYRRVDSDQFVSGRVAASLDWAFLPTASFSQLVVWFPGFEESEDQLVRSESRLRANLTESMFAQFQVLVDWDNTPSPGLERTDVKYILGVGWKF